MSVLPQVLARFPRALGWAGALVLCGVVVAPGGPAGASTPAVVISSKAAATCTTASDGCTSVVLPAQGPLGSTFVTPTVPVTVTDESSTTLAELALSMSAVPSGAGGTALEKGIDVCIHDGTTVLANGPLVRGLGATPSVAITGVTLKKLHAPTPASSSTFDVSYYVGRNSACGTVVSTNKKDAATWSTPAGSGSYVTPPSLDNPAEGGTVTVTIAVDLSATVTVPGGTTAGTTGTGSGTGTGTGTQSGTSNGASTIPVHTATGSATESVLAFTGLDVLLIAGSGALLLLAGFGLLVWRRRLASRR